MKVLFLMGGEKVEHKDGKYPLYMAEINEKLVLEKQTEYLSELRPSQVLFCVKSEDVKDFHVDDVIRQAVPNSTCITINNKTQGAVCSALLAAEHIDNGEELIVMAIDDFIDDSGKKILDYFKEQNCDAGVVSFTSVHPRYSFAKVDNDGMVSELAEKRPISKNALASFYYFKKGSDFVNSAKDVIRKDNPVNNAFYLSQTINEMILKQKKVGMYKIDNAKFHPLKSEMQLAQYMLQLKEEKESI